MLWREGGGREREKEREGEGRKQISHFYPATYVKKTDVQIHLSAAVSPALSGDCGAGRGGARASIRLVRFVTQSMHHWNILCNHNYAIRLTAVYPQQSCAHISYFLPVSPEGEPLAPLLSHLSPHNRHDKQKNHKLGLKQENGKKKKRKKKTPPPWFTLSFPIDNPHINNHLCSSLPAPPPFHTFHQSRPPPSLEVKQKQLKDGGWGTANAH